MPEKRCLGQENMTFPQLRLTKDPIFKARPSRDFQKQTPLKQMEFQSHLLSLRLCLQIESRLTLIRLRSC